MPKSKPESKPQSRVLSAAGQLLGEKSSSDITVEQLIQMAGTAGLEPRIEAGLRAYFEWARDMGSVAYGIYREGFDEASPAWRYRQQTIATVVGIVRQQAEALGFANLSELPIETLVNWIESAGATLFRHYPVSAEQIEEQRGLTTEMCLAMIEVVRG